jgi:serine/threonine-protein kinase
MQPISPPARLADPMIGRTLAGRFHIESRLAEGGMATVYRATEDGDPPRTVAVKVLRSELARDGTFVSRFRREARLAARLVHPSIVELFEHGSEGSDHFLVMELLEGEDLFDRLAREGRLDERTAMSIVAQVCDALATAHGEGIIHRDLKPENIFLTGAPGGEPQVKVLDFGIAKLLEPEPLAHGASTPNLTRVGTILGTPEYMSPEQCKSEEPGPRSDVYGCGVLLYVMLTGRPPFVDRSPVVVAARQVGEAPAPPHLLRPGLDPELEAVILRTLAKDPRQRPASAAHLADLLRARLQAMDSPATTADTAPPRLLAGGAAPPPPPLALAPTLVAEPAFQPGAPTAVTIVPPRRRWRRDRRVAIVALGVAAALVLALAVGLDRRAPAPRNEPAPSSAAGNPTPRAS